MTAARPDVERVIVDWLRAEASSVSPERVLASSISRIAATSQDRYLTQRLFGDRLGRSRELRVVMVAVLVALIVAAAAALVGSIRNSVPESRATNGWIALDGNGTAGADLSGSNLERNGHGDIYLVREGLRPRRIVGSDDDPLHQMCPVFSPDGSRLAYIQLDMRSVSPTPPPQPVGPDGEASFPPLSPVAGGPLLWRIGIVEVGSDGKASDGPIEVDAESSLASCAEWSPDGQRLAYMAETPGGQRELWLVDLDGQSSRIGPAVDLVDPTNYRSVARAFAWSPEGTMVALLDDEQLWLVPVDGGTPRSIPGTGFHTASWSRDGSMVAIGVGSDIRVLATDGRLIGTILREESEQQPAPFAWSPGDGQIAYVRGDDLVTVHPDGSGSDVHATGIGYLFEPTSDGFRAFPSHIEWSPDGDWLLVVIGAPDLPETLAALRVDGSEPPVLLVPPTYALRGTSASWQGVDP
jgi:WD40-like Beta Propeller Repeat